ncbi:ester cyclase [Leptolyngbyaceae cyanobacterium CCMR0082]|uniref:Ester cyclase n=2 Tax=Adonisia turfae TaxID=2950184 RepID=A0A6M0SEA6_9CYAN|nr:ester cyclase [Adonisia turfae]MDV3347283.1 ester cyclase [Leptothoe sp. LEGE 181152]NEZ56337.1 ester cyclase [Adonisia turfae CCMR0081]NEZ66840.1 ester cyclase [Adonisia turfae CCMR0082]
MSDTHQAIIRRYIEEVINKGNFSAIEEFVHPDYIFGSPSEEVQGADGLKGFIEAFRTAFPDLKIQVDDLATEKNKVVTCFTLTGTHNGDLMGIPATGKPVNVHGMILSRFKADKIIEEWEILDQLAMFQQLGFFSLPT